jgi:hypothetical protein
MMYLYLNVTHSREDQSKCESIRTAYGPMFLAWGLVCFQLHALLEPSLEKDAKYKFSLFTSAAMNCGVFSYLKDMLLSSELAKDEVWALHYTALHIELHQYL